MNFFYLFFQAWTEGHRVQKKTGSFLPEVANPYFRITEAGFNVESCTPNGGVAPIVRVYQRQIIKWYLKGTNFCGFCGFGPKPQN